MTDARTIILRRLGDADTDAYVALRHEMLEALPAVFLASPDQDLGTNREYMQERLEAQEAWHAVFGAFVGDVLVGTAGIVAASNHAKARHKAHLWGMYVAPPTAAAASVGGWWKPDSSTPRPLMGWSTWRWLSARMRPTPSGCTRAAASRRGAESPQR